MRKYLQVAISIAVVGGLAAGAMLRATRNEADPAGADEQWSTRKIMRKIHGGKQPLLFVVDKDIQKAEPDWKTDEENLAEIIRLMSMLTKRKPLRGSQEAWDKLVQEYVDQAKVVQQNVKEHKLQPARAALEKMGSTCDQCHDNHGIK
jgi:hypothetical protein